jgi:putative hemolysin
MGITVLSTIAVAGPLRLERHARPPGLHHPGVAVTFIMLLGEVIPKVYATGPSHARGPADERTPWWPARCSGPVNEIAAPQHLLHRKALPQTRSKNMDADALGHALELTKDASTTAEEQRILRGIVKFGNIEARR